MDRSYIAFISYRHRPLDMVVARKLHGMIERYRVPRALRTGSARLGLVFRDQEEMPVSSDLAANIREALERARYLIVVCTPDTPQSPWVEREIEYFLENHPRESVFAVLAAGKPEESFPRRLTHLYAEDGVTEVGQVEPLAANVVGRNRREVMRKLRSEKLRLIAGILGCPYDELRKRERRRARRRGAAAAAVAACVALAFIGVLWSGNVRMRAKNEALRRSQAEVLAQLASARLSQGDLYGAIESSAASLDDGSGNAPYVPLAEQVLCDALNPYGAGEIHTEAILRQRTQIEDLLTLGERVYTIDIAGTVRAFDVSGGAALWESARVGWACSPSSNSPRLYALDGGALLVKYGEEIRALSAESGATVWNFRLCTSILCDYAVLSGDGSALAVADYDYASMEVILHFLDTGDGREMGTVHWPAGEFEFESNSYRDKVAVGTFTNSGEFFVGCIYASSVDAQGEKRKAIRFFTVDLKDWSRRDFYTEEALYRKDPSVDSARTHVLGMALDEADEVLTVAACNDRRGIVLLERVRLADGELLSREGADWVEQARAPLDLSFDLEPRAGFFHTSLLSAVQLGSHLYFFDAEGGYLNDCDTWGECALCLDAYAWDNTFAVLTDGGSYGVGAVLENGAQLWSRTLQLGAARLAAPGQSGCLAAPEEVVGKRKLDILYESFVEPTEAGFVAVVPESAPNEVHIARPRMDPVRFGGASVPWEGGRLNGVYPADGWIVAVGQDRIELLDAASRARALALDTFAIPSSEQEYRVTSDGKYLLYPDGDGQMARCDLETGACEKLMAGSAAIDASCIVQSDPAGGAIVSARVSSSVSSELPLTVEWWLDGEPQDASTCPFSPEGFSSMVGEPLAGGGCVVAEYDGRADGLYFAAFSTADGSWRRIENPHNDSLEHLRCVGTQSPLLASLGDDGTLRIWNLETGEAVREFEADAGGSDTVQLRFLNGDSCLLLLTAGGDARIYDVESGECAFEVRTGTKATRYTRVSVGMDAGRNRLFLSVGEAGYCVEMDSWIRIATIPNLWCYLPETDEVLTGSPSGELCALPVLDVRKLVEYGRALTGE